MSLNCVGLLICGFFSIVSTTVLRDPWLVESVNVDTEEPQTQRADYKLQVDF